MTQLAEILAATMAIQTLPLAAPVIEPGTPPSCAMVQSIDTWTDVDNSTVMLETSPRRRYKVTFNAPCPDVKRAILALIQRAPSAGACLSPGDSIVFARKSPAGAKNYDYDERCVIKTITSQPIAETNR